MARVTVKDLENIVNAQNAQIAELNNAVTMLTALVKNQMVDTPAQKTANQKKKAPVAKTGAKKPGGKKQKTAEAPKKTYADAIKDWKIQKYGNLDTANKVQEMANVVAAEWRQQWIDTGKKVCAKNEYKTKLYEEAYKRVLAEKGKGKA